MVRNEQTSGCFQNKTLTKQQHEGHIMKNRGAFGLKQDGQDVLTC